MLLEKNRELVDHLRRHLAKIMKDGQDLFDSSVRDEGDRGQFGFEQEMNRRRMDLCNENLKLIRDALARLNFASYGICEECGAEISEKRLQVMPFAAHCLECQEALEEKRLSEKIRGWTEGGDRSRDH